jgi:glycosyltransferase involved in cell wall biosynthesis
MSKTTVVISCPIDTYSGYGARARDFVKALDKDKYDVKILAQRWGNTRFGYLEDHKEFELQSMIIPNLTAQPDVWIQVTVPNEFQKVGKYNIGLTAGMETDICPPEWIQGCNNMDLILTSSEHGKSSLVNSAFEVQDKNTGAKQSLKVTTEVEVIFEGVDLEKYCKVSKKAATELNSDLDTIKESFCYLFVGHWLQGAFSHDRKNVGWTIKAFLETFKNKKNPPALILKTQHANASITDRDTVFKKIDDIRKTVRGTLPNIYVVHGELSDGEINELYNHSKVKAMINFTKGEGYGRPLLEFSLTGKPIIASGWSGHLDFLNKEFTTLVGGGLHNVDKSAVQKGLIIEQAQWFQANEAEVGRSLKNVFEKYKKYEELGKRQRHYAKTNFSVDKMAEKLDEILSQRLPEFPKQVQLELPKLQLPKLQKL